ncbi:prolyl oligopeptidase family serine peptidase [Caulobacter sp. LARHSG274]
MRTIGLGAAIALLSASMTMAAQPPKAATKPHVDHYFGETVVDDYHWMEARDPEFAAWMKGQDDVTRAEIAALPGRKALGESIAAFTAATATPTSLDVRGDKVFFLLRPPGAGVPKLFVRDLAGGEPRMLIDPEPMKADGGPVSLSAYVPSPDGRRIAYTLTSGGSEDAVLHVLDVASGQALPESIDRARFAQPDWAPDGKSFLYTRLKIPTPGMPEQERFQDEVVWRHVVGEDPAKDVKIFEASRPDSGNGRDGIPFAYQPKGADVVFLLIQDGVSPYGEAWIAPAASVAAGRPVFRKIASLADKLVILGLGSGGSILPAVRGGKAWVATTLGSPYGRIVELDLSKPDMAHARQVAPGEGGALSALAVAADGLYVARAEGGAYAVSHIGWNSAIRPVSAPFVGSVDALTAEIDQPGALGLFQSWARPPEAFRLSADKPAASLALARPFPFDLSAIVVDRIEAKAPDGTIIPVDVLHLKGMKRDGSAPTLLESYGAYGISADPFFQPRMLPWVLRGGVYANAHVRGGSEYGEAWHLAGKEATKPNTWRDFIAAGEALIAEGYTSKAKLAGTGTSAGGVLIGRAVTERPDLFAAAFMGVPMADMLRFETTEGGPANVNEFGSTRTEAGYRALKAMSPLVHVADATAYPATIISAGMNDHRVPGWVPAKMAARMQAASTGGPVRLRVDFDAGHGFGSTKAQRDQLYADVEAFLLQALGDPEFQPKAP